jgi:hypothetical protein
MVDARGQGLGLGKSAADSFSNAGHGNLLGIQNGEYKMMNDECRMLSAKFI